MDVTSFDLLDELRAALDELEPLLAGRIVDVEMSRLRVLADSARFRREFVSLVESAVADAEPTYSVTVRVARKGKVARVEVFREGRDAQSDVAIGSMTLPLVPGGSSAADTRTTRIVGSSVHRRGSNQPCRPVQVAAPRLGAHR